MSGDTWILRGYDAFAGDWYPIGAYASHAAALAAAQTYLAELERTQPTAHTGGQADGGIQDRVYLWHPDGTQERLLPLQP